MYKNFVHFRLHTEYNIKKSILKIEDIFKELKKDKHEAVCIADDNLFNMQRFYKSCFENNIKPIIGVENEIEIKNKNYNILLLIKNKKGYLNISKLVTRAFLYNNKKIKLNWLKGELKSGLILILNLNSFYYNNFENLKNLKKKTLIFKKILKKNIYLEIQKYNNSNYNKIINISNFFKIPLLPVNPISFVKKKDFLAYKAKIYIYKKKSENLKISKNHYFLKKKKISKIFKDIKNSLKNTFELSKKCNFYINFNKIKLPFFRIKSKKNINIYFIKKLINKLKSLKNINNYKKYKKRLFEELKVVIQMNLCDYFLIVSDFVKWSKKKNFIIGPGRGSSASSLISFLLNITALDPIKYNLIFERFLNLERVSIPDFDIDFSQNDRKKTINYMKKKYGIDCICNIITFNKLALKASIKDIGKFLNFNYDFINEINKLIPLNNNLKILELIKKNKNFYNKYKKKKNIKKLIKLTNKLEGLTKNIGVHAGGLLVTPNKTFYYAPLLLQKKKILSHFFKDDIEEIGILKFDFLKLATLSVIKNCLKKIKKKIEFKNLKLNDKACYENFKKANTDGVFQLESKGLKNILKKIKPDCLENLIAIISLYRPGPIKLIEDFCLKKLGLKKVSYIDNSLKNILQETYGIIIYQEQIIKIAQTISNYSLSEADIFRKIISKKNKLKMHDQKKIFIEKGIKNGFRKEKIEAIFNIIKEFANYGFNKAHACAYSLLTYFTMWLKTYYNSIFIAANMSYCLNDAEKLKIFIEDALKNNIKILPININMSENNFLSINKKNKKIRYGFRGITGLGKNIIRCICKTRGKKFFKSFKDFYFRINKSVVNYKSIESLISCGSFDSINYNRANLIKKLKIFHKMCFKKKEKTLLKNLYFRKNYYWNFKTKILEEKNTIGFFLLNNIYNIYKKRIEKKFNYKKLIKGIITFISNKNNNNFFIFINNEKNEKIIAKIDKNLVKNNIKNIKKNSFIMFIKKDNESKFIIVKKIINIC